jgi:hypothetical protein
MFYAVLKQIRVMRNLTFCIIVRPYVKLLKVLSGFTRKSKSLLSGLHICFHLFSSVPTLREARVDNYRVYKELST